MYLGIDALLGKHSDDYSTHSFMRGTVTWAFSAEVPTELIQLYGDWQRNAYKKYLKFNLEDKICVANKSTSLVASFSPLLSKMQDYMYLEKHPPKISYSNKLVQDTRGNLESVPME
jgi:hypothetical protein